MPIHTTEVVMLTGPINTKIGDIPKYNSANMPKGIKIPINASQEIGFVAESLSLKCNNK